MITLQTYVRKLQSPKSAVRLDACEELWAVSESSPEVIYALEKAACDENIQVADAARHTLSADIHRMMAAEMGIIPLRRFRATKSRRSV